jgi:protein-S-isoprenylcysteine O-methyltransferase Ste14
MGRLLILLYGIASYGIFFLTFLYIIAFLGNLTGLPVVGAYVTKTVDSGTPGPVGYAMLVNAGLIAIFGFSHTIMARPWFKRRWTKIVPEVAERSTYVLVASLALIMLIGEWQPMTDAVWSVTDPTWSMVLWVLYFAGFGIVLLSTFLINHFDLFGLSQIMANMQGRTPSESGFVQPLLYKLVRHPMYLGFVIAFWATPEMSAGHLLFALGMTAYILAAIPHEEVDLEAGLGESYAEYKKRVPMLVPFLKSKG